jgi:hypothetical protein
MKIKGRSGSQNDMVDAQDYLMREVTPLLQPVLMSVVKHRPADPLRYIINMLRAGLDEGGRQEEVATKDPMSEGNGKNAMLGTSSQAVTEFQSELVEHKQVISQWCSSTNERVQETLERNEQLSHDIEEHQQKAR